MTNGWVLLFVSISTLFSFVIHVADAAEDALVAQAAKKNLIISIGTDSFSSLSKDKSINKSGVLLLDEGQRLQGSVLSKINESSVNQLSAYQHDKYHRCGGFVVHDSIQDAKDFMARSLVTPSLDQKNSFFLDYDINQEELVNPLLKEVSEINILTTIQKLSSYFDRYYTSATGVESANWIYQQLKSLSKSRSDISVELFKHESWAQPSVIATIKGETNEKIIIGGHLDSINQRGGFFGRKSAAPGADDNASGIATWMEAFRVLSKNGYRPKHTIQFMGYAAEEVGLRGSNAIAKQYKAKGEKVLGALQFDMTNFKNHEKDIFLISDYTNQEQNKFLGNLIDTYIKLPWGFTKCGYACSDHASWNGQGYVVSYPFETAFETYNKKIHTTADTLSVSQNSANHATKFARLAVAYVLELDN
ncbi:MAG: M28 family metallopeptidase [Bacteriovoracaceae bacterium]|nr:M28 family metallopeptidase [Bacteriovoracaceae bacterium]